MSTIPTRRGLVSSSLGAVKEYLPIKLSGLRIDALDYIIYTPFRSHGAVFLNYFVDRLTQHHVGFAGSFRFVVWFLGNFLAGVRRTMTKKFGEMSETELQSMIDEAGRALKEKQQGKRKEVLNQMKQLAASIGVTIEIIEAPDSGSGRKGRKVPIKYRNPQNPAEQWSGRGVKPKWLQQLLAQGKRIEDFEVAS